MSRKSSILIIIAIVLVIIGGLIFFYLSSNKTPAPVTETPQTTNPFGNTTGNRDNIIDGQTGNSQSTSTSKNLAKLIQIYRNPTSGSIFLSNKSNQDVLMFVDRATGNTYQYIPEEQTGEAKRVTNTTIPKIQETVWSSSGKNLVLRYLDNDTDNISSFAAKIEIGSSTVESSGEIIGSFLASNIKQMAINPKGDKIFNLVDKSDKSGSFGFTTGLGGDSKKIIFDSPVSYWNISWPKDNTIVFTTKPSYRDYGFLYYFNPQTYSMERILGNIVGLSTLVNKDASLVAYSYTSDNLFYLDVYDAVSKISKNIKISTFADKCAWGNKNSKILYCAIPEISIYDNYPDVWYQGLVSFRDNIWKIDTETGKTEEIYFVGSNEIADIDGFDMKVSLSDQYLVFSNKNDLSLWLLDISQN